MDDPPSQTLPKSAAFTATGGLRAFFTAMERLGVDPNTVLETLNLSVDVESVPRNWLFNDTATLDRFLDEVRLRCGKEFALYVGQRTALNEVGLSGFLATKASTVFQAIELHNRATNIVDSFSSTLEVTADQATICFDCDFPQFRNMDVFVERRFAFMCKMIRELVNEEWSASEVHFSYRTPSYLLHYGKIFRCPLKFEQPQNKLIFESSVLERATPRSDPALLRILLGRLEELENERADKDEFINQVTSQIRACMASGDVSVARVSNQLAMSKRSLQRRLSSRGTSFTQLLNAVREARAYALLQREEITVSQVSDALGYSGPAAFDRAFRRWAGMTPREYKSLYAKK